MITRAIQVNYKGENEPIDYVQGANALEIQLKIVDYEIPAGASAATIVIPPTQKARTVTTLIQGNTVIIRPTTLTFTELGFNKLQVSVVANKKTLVTFVYNINVRENLTGTPADPAPEADPLLAQLFEATANANDAATNAVAIATAAANNATTTINNAVSEANDRVGQVVRQANSATEEAMGAARSATEAAASIKVAQTTINAYNSIGFDGGDNTNIINKILTFIANFLSPFTQKVLTSQVTLIESSTASMYTENGCVFLQVQVPSKNSTTIRLCTVPTQYAPRAIAFGSLGTYASDDSVKCNRIQVTSTGECIAYLNAALSQNAYATFVYPLRR